MGMHKQTHTYMLRPEPAGAELGKTALSRLLVPLAGPHLTPELHGRQLHPISANRFMRTNCTRYIVPNAAQ